MVENLVKMYFSGSGMPIQTAAPDTEVTLIIEVGNNSRRPTNVEAVLSCSLLPEIHKKKIKFTVKGNDRGVGRVPITLPSKFDTIPIDAEIDQKSGRYARPDTILRRAVIRLLTQKTVEIAMTPEMEKIVQEIQKLHGELILVPDVSDKAVITPVVGDITSAPNIALSIPTTKGIALRFICSSIVLRDLRNNTSNAITELERVEENQGTLRFLIDQYRAFLKKIGAEVEGPVGSAHIKVGPNPILLYYASQVTPSEDNAVIDKINAVITDGKKDNAFVTVLVTDIDDNLREINQKDSINVIDVFHGIELKGTWQGDHMFKEYLRSELQLSLTDEELGGGYSLAEFRKALEG